MFQWILKKKNKVMGTGGAIYIPVFMVSVSGNLEWNPCNYRGTRLPIQMMQRLTCSRAPPLMHMDPQPVFNLTDVTPRYRKDSKEEGGLSKKGWLTV